MILGDMEVRLRADYARLQRDLDQARGLLGTAVGHFERMAGAARTALGAIGLGLSVTALAGWIKGAIDAADATDELSEKTGVLSKDLAGLQLIFQREGIDGDAMTASLSKLSKGIVDGNDGLSALGINAKNTSGEFRTTQSVLYEVADRFAEMENGSQKAALAIEIFGKSGTSLIPMLNGGSEGMREMAEMAQKLGLVIDEETAKKAGDFNDTLFLLQQGSQGVARGLAAELLPTLTSLTGSLLESMSSGDALARTGRVLSAGLKTLYTVGGVVVETFKTVGTVVGALAAGITNNLTGAIDVLVKVSNGDFKGAWDSMKKTVSSSTGIYVDAAKDIGASWKAMGTNIAQAWEGDGNAAVLAAAKQAKAQKDLQANQKLREEAEKKAAAAREAASSAADKFIEAQAQEIAQVGLTVDQIKLLTATRAASLAPTEEQRKKILEQASALSIATKAYTEKTEAEKAAAAAIVKSDEALHAATAGVWDQVAALEKQVTLYGLTEDEVLRLQKTKLQADLAAAEGDEKKIAALTLQIQGTERLIELNAGLEQKKAGTKAGEEMLAEQKRAVDKYRDIFRTGFADMLNNGKAGWKSFTTSLVTTFKTTVADQIYKMMAEPFVVKMIGTLLGVSSLPLAQAGNVAGNAALSAGGSAASSALGLAGAGAAFGSSAMAGFSAAWGAGGSLVSTLSTAFAGATAAPIASLGLALGAVAPVALALYAAVKLFDKGEEKNTRLTFTSNNTPGNISINERGNEGKLGQSYIDGSSAGAFGTFGLSSTFWMDGRQEAVQSFIKTVTQVDDALAGFLTASEKASVTAAITGKSFTANTGAQSANPNGSGQLDTVFANRLNAVFEGVAPGLSSLISGFKGTTQELATESAALLQYRQALVASGEAVFGAKVTMQELAALKTPSEATSAALARITSEFAATNAVAAALGKTGAEAFGAVGLASLGAREQLITLAGGMDALGKNIGSFAQNYLSEAERLAPVTKAVEAAMAELGLSSITTREQFKQQVQGLDLTTEAGAKLFGQLMGLQDAFAQAHPAVEDNAALLQLQAQRYEVLGDTAGAAAILEQQHVLALKDMTPALAAANQALWDAEKAEKVRLAAAEEAAAILDLQAQMYEANGDKAGAAAVLLAQHKAALVGLSPALAAATQATWDAQAAAAKAQLVAQDAAKAQTAIDTARSALSSAYDREAGALKSVIQAKLAEADATRKQMDALKLGNLSTLSPELKLAEAKRQFDAAKGADKNALSGTYLEALKGYYGSTKEYADGYAKVQAALAISAASSSAEATIAQQQLSKLDRQVSLLVAIEKNGVTSQQAIFALGTALNAGTAAQAAQGGAAQTGIIGALYQELLGRQADASGLAFWQQQSKAGMSLETLIAQIKGSAEYAGLHGSHRDGLGYVPFDGYRAELHRGERVQTAAQVRDGDENLAKAVGLLEEVLVELRADKAQRGAVGTATLAKLDKVSDELSGVKRTLAATA